MKDHNMKTQKERPILFNAQMILALLNGSKTQARRAVNPQPYVDKHGNYCWNDRNFGQDSSGPRTQAIASQLPSSETGRVICPQGKPGDRLWVRETWRIGAWDENKGALAIDYMASPPGETPWITVPEDLENYYGESVFEKYWMQSTDDCIESDLSTDADGKYHWEPGQSPCRVRPSTHMPRWASRITLEITGVRMERLHEISEADAMAEGCTENHNGYFWGGPHAVSGLKQMVTAKKAYCDLWESINGPGSWDVNPWVWVVEFKRVPQ